MNRNRINSSRLTALILCSLILLVNAGAALANVKLPSIIGDNMVLQRGKQVTIWGWANPGEEVMASVSWHGMKWAVTADEEGKWSFKMNSPDAGGPYEMTISGKNVITIKNILVGEIWVCSGQSNMQWAVRQSNNAEQEIAEADYPNIRLFSVERTVADKPQPDCTGSWTPCSPETVPGFSAVAYYFGRQLHKELNVPIGLIHTSWGGTPAEAWTRREVLKADADFAPILSRYDEAIAKYPQVKEEYEQKLEEWKKAVEKAKADGTNAPRRPSEPFGPGHPETP